MKALIIDEPWIGKILRGEKSWEMRKTASHQRGRIALIRKGSGLVVGTADLVDSLSPVQTPQAFAEAEALHGIPPDRQGQAFADGWTTPWVLTNAHTLTPPVPYRHPYGAVIWVNLDAAVADAVMVQGGKPASTAGTRLTRILDSNEAGSRPTSSPAPPSMSIAAQRPLSRSADMRRVVVTGGNVRNDHIYLPLEFFPEDAIGGKNKAEAAPRSLSVTFHPGVTVETDIDRSKRILRMRGPVRDFLARAGVSEGDTILITRNSSYAYTISKASDS